MPGNKAAQERAAKRKAGIELRKQAEREARRAAHKETSIAGSLAAHERQLSAVDTRTGTFGDVVERHGLVSGISVVTRKLIRETVLQVDEFGRKHLQVLPSCHTCVASKGCCKITVAMYLYEAVPIAARLRRDVRDTPDLRRELAAAADAMEATTRDHYQRPCVFLDAAERCTVYDDRPSQCGTELIFSDPAICSSTDPAARVEKFPSPMQATIPPALEMRFLDDVGLRRTDHVYVGALPRMVLLCLEAWDRTDYVDYLSVHARKAAFAFGAVIGATR